jgi:hypothetical protein
LPGEMDTRKKNRVGVKTPPGFFIGTGYETYLSS